MSMKRLVPKLSGFIVDRCYQYCTLYFLRQDDNISTNSNTIGEKMQSCWALT